MKSFRALLVVLWALVASARGQVVRLANGTPIQGTIKQIKAEGIEMETPAGVRLFTWETLSWGTRYRYQESFRSALSNILAGTPAQPRTVSSPSTSSPPASTGAPTGRGRRSRR